MWTRERADSGAPVSHVAPAEARGVFLLSVRVALVALAAGCGPDWDDANSGSVERGPFEILHVVDDGELAALRTSTISSRVRGEIRFLVKDLALVKKGDVLVELDTTDLTDHVKQLRDGLVLAEKRLTEALRNQEIRAAQIEVELKKKDAALRLAEVRHETLRAGAKPDDIALAEKSLEAAEAARKFAESSLADAEALLEKGYATRSELDERRLSKALADARFEKARMELDRLRAGPTPHDLRPAELAVEAAKIELAHAGEEKRSAVAELKATVAQARSSVSSQELHIRRHDEELEQSTIRAPRDGLVARCTRHWESTKVDVGSHVWSGAGIVELPDLSAMKVKIRIPETFVRHFAVDDRIEVELEDVPNEKIGGSIVWIDTWARDRNADLAQADMKREGLSGVRVFRADVKLDRTDERMRLGSKARVFLRATLPNAVRVDRRAIVRRGGKPHARVIRDGRQGLAQVVLGEATKTHYLVKRGLEPGTRVAFVDLPGLPPPGPAAARAAGGTD